MRIDFTFLSRKQNNRKQFRRQNLSLYLLRIIFWYFCIFLIYVPFTWWAYFHLIPYFTWTWFEFNIFLWLIAISLWVAIYTFPVTEKTRKTIYTLIYWVVKSFSNELIATPFTLQRCYVCTRNSIILEQIAEYLLGALFEISEKFTSILTAFSYIILQWWLNILE